MKKRLTGNEGATLILIATLVFGVWLRLNAVLLAGFPMNDGGMFFRMIEELRQNHFSLPVYTAYNNQQIPFAYPPLTFYLAGIVADLGQISVLKLMLWLPAIFNIASLPAFWLLANAVMETRIKAAVATLVYMLMPLSMDWFLMGGGLTRGMGQLFLILTCWGAYQLFQQPSQKHLSLTILSGAGVVLSHPESALLTVICAGIIWAFSPRNKQNFLNAILVCMGVSVLISPWLIKVISIHGIEPFLKAAQTSGNELFLWVNILTFNITQEPSPTFLAVLGLIGLFAMVSQKKYLLPVWVILPYFIDPRSAARAALLPLAMLAATCLLDILLPTIMSLQASITSLHRTVSRPARTAGYLFLGYLLLNLIINGYNLSVKMAANRLSPADESAMAWVKQNTPHDSRFVLLTGELQLLRDPIQEWFPALTERTSETTLQGREWIWGDKFIQAILTFDSFQRCITQDAQCVKFETDRLKLAFEYLYIKVDAAIQCGESDLCQFNGKNMVEELKKSPDYQLVYEGDGAVIFRKAASHVP